MTSLLIASTNPGKLVEIEAILKDMHLGVALDLVLPIHLGIYLDVKEDGQTYAENAALKARAFCRAADMATLADDTGLEVEVLGGEPGLHSARYTGKKGATDAERRAFLLSRLADKPLPWKAAFRCTVALALPGEPLQYAEGICPGEIIGEERGSEGFGYDPIFFLPEYGMTMAELGMAVKNRISHRARALQAIRQALTSL